MQRPLHRAAKPQEQDLRSIRIGLAGANPAPQITGLDTAPARVNYLLGSDPKRWHLGVPTYDRVRYAGVYPGVDLIFYGNRQNLECDFDLAPGANPDAIRLSIEGADSRIDESGNVSMRVGPGVAMTLRKPAIYQHDARGGRIAVQGHYVWSRSQDGTATLGFAVASYDRSRPLVIDPQLVYSTYLTGSQPGSVTAIAVDSNGLIYVTGNTQAADFPITEGAFETASSVEPSSAATPGAAATPEGTQSPTPTPTPAQTYLEGEAAFVTVLNPAASGDSQLVYSTYLGGYAQEQSGAGIAVDSRGFIYVTGMTSATDFPLSSGAFETVGNREGAAFVTVLNPAANGSAQLVYSTLLAGSGQYGDEGGAIAVDPGGRAYVAGTTSSSDFPVTSNALATINKAFPNRNETAFVSVLDPSLSGSASLVYSTYLGGSTADSGSGIALSSMGSIYVTGSTNSADFAVTPTAFKTRFQSDAVQNAFVTVLNPALGGTAQLLYSTYLGGASASGTSDFGRAIAVDANGFAYVTGGADSPNFPITANAIQKTFKTPGAVTGFVSRLDPTKSGTASLAFSSLLGGSGGDQATGIAVDSRGYAYVTGATGSSDFPLTKGAFQTVGGDQSAFLSVINTGVNGKPPSLVYSTLFGFGNQIQANGVAVDSNDVAYIGGVVNSGGVTTTSNALQPELPAVSPGSFSSGFVAILDPGQALQTAPASLKASPSALSFPQQFFGGFRDQAVQASASQTIVFSYNPSNKTQTAPITIQGLSVQSSDDQPFQIASSGTTCALGLSLTPGSSCSVSLIYSPAKLGAESGALILSDNASNGPQKITLKGKSASGPLVVSPATLDFGRVPLNQARQETALNITLTNNNSGPIAITSSAMTSTGFRPAEKGFQCSPPPGRGAGPNSSSVPANGSCEVGVTFNPSTTGKVTATLTIDDGASNSPQIVKLTGVALPAVPGPTPIPR